MTIATVLCIAAAFSIGLSIIVGTLGVLRFHRRADRAGFGTALYERNFWLGQLCLSLAQAFGLSGSALGFLSLIATLTT